MAKYLIKDVELMEKVPFPEEDFERAIKLAESYGYQDKQDGRYWLEDGGYVNFFRSGKKVQVSGLEKEVLIELIKELKPKYYQEDPTGEKLYYISEIFNSDNYSGIVSGNFNS